MNKFFKIAVCVSLSLLGAGALSAAHSDRARVDRLSRRSAHGHIAVKAGSKALPGNAKISFARTHSENVKGKVVDGLAKNWRGRRNGGKASAHVPSPRVIAMYDVSIDEGGRKWQPAVGEPVKVTVELAEPVAVGSGVNLEVAHLADDGTVEELDAARYGFTYSADRSAVTAFWFSAAGFSVYAIVDRTGELVTPRRFYHFYDHPSDIENSNAVRTFPYRYTDLSNDVVNVQIVKDGDALKEPPVPQDILDENGVLVSTFEGWYVVHVEQRPAEAAERKLDSSETPFTFVWPVGVTDQRLAFTNGVHVTESVDMDYYVVPLYEHARYLQFNETELEEQASGSRIIDRKIIAINDETGIARIKVSDVSAALKNSRQEYFCGWSYLDKNGQYTDLLLYSPTGTLQEAYIEIDNELFAANGGTVIPLYPVYVSAHFLNFDTNAKGTGATYIGSLFIRSTTDLSAVTPSGNRPGYDFDGWCVGTLENGKVVLGTKMTDASGNFIANTAASVTNTHGEAVCYTDAQGNIRLRSDVVLYASWKANSNAPYRVIVWQQRVTDAKDAVETNKTYYYATHYSSVTVSATTVISDSLFKNFTGTRADGTSVSAKDLSTLSGKADANVANEDFTGLHYARWACADTTVAPDGSTVINVYYDRDLITLRFCLYDSNQTETIYTTTTSTSGDIYGTDDGESYFAVYYDNGQWYSNRTLVVAASYSDQYTGNRYVKSGNNYSQDNSGTTGTHYGRSGTILNYSYFEIYYNSADGKWYKNYTPPSYVYSGPYTGYRYTASTSNWIVNQTMTGLYGQTLAGNGYTWPSERRWYDGNNGNSTSGTQISFLDAFLPTSGGDETFYSTATTSTSSSNTKVYFYKENLDGTWLRVNEFDSGSSSVNFNISDKYNGFEAYQYSTDGESTWKAVGAYNASTGYYGSQVSGASKLSIRFKRKKFELIYKDGDNTVYDTGKNVPYESSLAGYDFAVTNALLNWGSRDITVGTFAGWYEDASLTVPFDFGATMPDGKKFLYAKWNPVKYKVIIDPNGGEMQSGDSTWFYLDAGERIIEYTLTRNYRLDMHNGTFYYHHDLWDPVKDKHTDQYDPSTSGAPRLAYYTENIDEATTNEVSNPENRFSYEANAYSFMGWYEVLENGKLGMDPFNFSEPPNRPVTIRAIWRRTSVYTLQYESIDPDGVQQTQVINDPELGVDGGYIDDGVTTLAKNPTNYDHEKWIWEGWQVVDVRNNNNPLTNIRSPGDTYIVHATHADDRNNVIHFRAVYSLREAGTSRHIPEVVDFVLDSNEGGMLATNQSVQAQEGRVGTYAEGAEGVMGGLNAGVWFAGQMDNFSVNLADYSSTFAHQYGYFLLGWDTNRVNTTMIPAYYANETVGIDKSNTGENVLYAVWEPQIYIEFVNNTGTNLTGITLTIPVWTEGDLFRVNTVGGVYERTPFESFGNGFAVFDLAAGETLRLVLPDGADKNFTVSGTCTFPEGKKLAVNRIAPLGGSTIGADDVAYPGDAYMVSGVMQVSPSPVQVVFTSGTYVTSREVPVRYFIHELDGTTREITHDTSSWAANADPVTNITDVGSTKIDLAEKLRFDANTGVHGFLSLNNQTNYGHTAIGIGAANGAFDEYRSITKREASGGSYLRFFRESLQWSRYSQVWNGYGAESAVYVVFYHRVPVHVTVGKAVIGTAADKVRKFGFTVDFVEHSETYEYIVTNKYKKTRSVTATRSRTSDPWPAWTGQDWSECTEVQDGAATTNTPTLLPTETDQHGFTGSRLPETVNLADGERHPVTVYYNRIQAQDANGVTTFFTGGGDSNINYYQNTTSTRTTTERNAKYKTGTQTTNYTQVVVYQVTYQYETAVIREDDDETGLFDLEAIVREQDGEVDLANRSYTVSSRRRLGNTNYFDYNLLDTVTFTNAHKTAEMTVSKTVQNGDESDTFHFFVTLDDTVGDRFQASGAATTVSADGKVAAFNLTHGDAATLRLPVGVQYNVTEGADERYVTRIPANASGTFAADGAVVPFVNLRRTEMSIAVNGRTVYFTGAEQTGYDITEATGTSDNVISNTEYVVTGLRPNDVLTVEHHVAAHGTAVGSYVGNFGNARITVRDASDNDVTREYIISTTPGSLTVEPTPIIVIVTGNHDTKTYNGQEQSCAGYTYVIKHAITDDEIVNENILVSITPEYQQAFRKDVGRQDMYIQPGRVSVTMPEGVSISNIVVAANGYIEIAPAPATVTADDKEKFMGDIDPAFTVTVSGLFGEDTVAYTVSRAAGEDVGEYAITPAGAADQGNYAVTFVPGKLTVTQLALFQRSTDSVLPVMVQVTRSMLEASGYDMSGEITAEAVSNYLNQVDANSLRRWENLVTGTATNQLILSDAVSASGNQLTFSKLVPAGNAVDLGYTVLYELQKNTSNGWGRIAGPAVGLDATFTIELLDAQGRSIGASGFYRLATLLVPDDFPAVTNAIPSTNIVGVLEVASTLTNTMTAVPWTALAHDPATNVNVVVQNYVDSSDLTSGDLLHAISSSGTYQRYTLKDDDEAVPPIRAWNAAKATIKGGSSEAEETPSAENRGLTRNEVVWVTRQETSKPFFLIGQYSDEDVNMTVGGKGTSATVSTMIANPSMKPLAINDIDWGSNPTSSDVIWIPTEKTVPTTLMWKKDPADGKKKWGILAQDRATRTSVLKSDWTVPAGMGFWYNRKGAAFTVTLPTDKPTE